MIEGEWICPGGERPHPVELEVAMPLPDFGSNSVSVECCRSCGALYHHLWFEVSDWGENGDYYSETHRWTPLAAEEVARLRANPRYQPRAEAVHRRDSPWRAG